MRIIAFDFCAPVNMVCVIMSCWEIDIESLSVVHDKPYLVGFEPRSLACKAKLYGFKYYSCTVHHCFLLIILSCSRKKYGLLRFTDSALNNFYLTATILAAIG